MNISILGDSISTFSTCNPTGYQVYYQGERCEQTGVLTPGDTWWTQVARRLNGRILANGSFSGSTVDGVGFPAGCSVERVAALASHGIAPDMVIVFMGINDYGGGGLSAQAHRRDKTLVHADSNSGGGGEPGFASSDALARFSHSYHLMLQRIRVAYSQAIVWCCTLCPGRVPASPHPTFVTNFRGIPFDKYNDAIRQAAHDTGCLVADLRSQGLDYEAWDGTHPTVRGMRHLADLVIQAMDAASGDSSNRAARSGENELFSAELCAGRSCVDCVHARSVGSDWFLVCEQDRHTA